jgi:hypothetical protein
MIEHQIVTDRVRAGDDRRTVLIDKIFGFAEPIIRAVVTHDEANGGRRGPMHDGRESVSPSAQFGPGWSTN